MVDENLFIPSVTHYTQIQEEEEKEKKEQNQLLDICEMRNINRKEVPLIMSLYKQLLTTLDKKYKRKSILAYATYTILSQNEYLCSPEDIVSVFQLKNKRVLFHILNETNHVVKPDIKSYSDSYCFPTHFKYKEKTFIRDICTSLEKDSQVELHPKTLCVLVIYYYCKLMKPDLSISEIAKLCTVHTSRIYKLIKNDKKPEDKAAHIRQYVQMRCGKSLYLRACTL